MPYKDPSKNREYQREWARKRAAKVESREVIQSGRRARVHERIREVDAYKEGKPCVDCGKSFHPVAMDFDHLDSATKVCGVSQMIRGGWAMETIWSEIAKCELVCANCHRVRTHTRGY